MPEEAVDYLRQAHPPRSREGAAPDAAASTTMPGHEVEVVSLKEEARMIHEEARTVLPGIQALFGFQLIAVFNRPFFDLAAADRVVHLVALLMVATAIGLIMAPAAYHRLSEPGVISRRWIGLASRDIAWAMVALMLAIGLDVYLVALMIARWTLLAAVLGVAAGATLGWLWFAVPLKRAHQSKGRR
jgi:Family of unknown function (DUF6328)